MNGLSLGEVWFGKELQPYILDCGFVIQLFCTSVVPLRRIWAQNNGENQLKFII